MIVYTLAAKSLANGDKSATHNTTETDYEELFIRYPLLAVCSTICGCRVATPPGM